MSLKLNLGAGTFPFPYERGSEPNPDHVLPLPEEVYMPGWVNVDKFPLPGIQEQINLFRFPWIRSSNGNPFNDNSVDYIYAAHFLEHMPHEVRVSNRIPLGWKEYSEFVENYDGFFVFFSEVWRVLKPDGLIHIRCPYAVCYDSLCDPTHTRYLTPGAFSYLTGPGDDSPFDYHNHARFESSGPIFWRMPQEFAAKVNEYTPEGFDNVIRTNYSAVTEFRITLRAVKD